jgi:glutathione S-transferase
VANGRTVWGVGTTRTIRAHWVLHELGLEYETRAIQSRTGETQTDEYLRMNPRGKIPLLVEGDLVLAESGAIAAHLADTHAPGKLAPAPGSRERAIHDQWCFFILMELDATSLYVVRRHDGLPEIYGDAPMAVESSLVYFRRQLEVAEAELADGRSFLLGEDFQVADIHLTSCLLWASAVSETLSDSLMAYRGRTTSRPAFQAANAINFPPEVMAALSANQK